MFKTDFLTDCVDLEPFAAELGRHPRTWMGEPDGLPFIRIGNRVLVHIPTAREWLLNRMRHPNQRRVSKAA
jgi:hypothetical protein